MIKFLLFAIAIIVIGFSIYCGINSLNDWLDYLAQPQQELIINK